MTVAIDEGVVVWIGPSMSFPKHDFPSESVIDGQGGWLAPGFIDNHIHLSATGFLLSSRYLMNVRSNQELVSAIMNDAPAVGTIYYGHGWENVDWNPSILEVPFPAYASRIDAHSAVVSASLIDLVPTVRTLSGFTDSGYLTGDAHTHMREFVESKITSEAISRAINAGLDELFSNGIVAIHEMSGPAISSAIDAQLVLQESRERGMHTFLWWGELEGQATAQKLGAYGCGGDLFIDGSLGSKTAALTQEYDDNSLGNLYLSKDEVRKHIEAAISHDLPVGFHAIGDAAITTIASALNELRNHIDSVRELDFRIEHAELVDPDVLEVFRDFGVSFSVQPHFDSLWGGDDGMYSQRIGQKWTHLNCFSDYQKAGISLLFGSDSPVTSFNPWSSIQASLSMHNEQQSLSGRAAFRAHTTQGWRQVGDSRSHNIEVGSPADFALWRVEKFNHVAAPDVVSRWSTDPRGGVAPLPDLDGGLPECLMTVTNGQIRFVSEDLA